MQLNYTGRVVLIAGSSQGIGFATARELFAEGASIIVSGRRPGAVTAAAESIAGREMSRVLAVAGDLSVPETLAQTLHSAVERFGHLDGLVSCIGDGRGSLGWKQGEPAWIDMFERNLWPTVRLCEAVIPLLEDQPSAAVVLVGSIAGRERLGPTPYGTAKAALAAYATRLAADVAPQHIRVNCVEPGNVLVPGGRWEQRLAADPEGIKAMLDRDVPMQRLGTPEEVADVISFVLSSRASFLTGARIVVDGGQTHD